MNRALKQSFALSGLLGATLTGSAVTEWDFARGSLSSDVSASTTYDSNVTTSAGGASDIYLAVTPTLRYRTIDSLLASDALLAITGEHYFQDPNLDNTTINSSYSTALLRTEERHYGVNLGVSFNQTEDPDQTTNTRIRSDTFDANLGAEFMLARVHLIRLNTGYNQSIRDGGSDEETFHYGTSYGLNLNDGTEIGPSYRHQDTTTTSKTPGALSLDQASDDIALTISRPLYADVRGRASLGYRWLNRSDDENLNGLEDTEGYTIGFGLTGQFLPKRYFPKTTGTFNIGYEDAATPGINDDATRRVIGALNLDWKARDATSVGFGVSRSQDLNVSDQTVIENDLSLHVTERIGHFTSATLLLGYTLSDFAASNRTDNSYRISSSVGYSISSSWSASFIYTYLLSDSTSPVADYDRHTASLSANYVF